MPLDQTNWKQDTETKPDVFSLEGLIAWLERQPAEIEYDFVDCKGGCLIGLYASGMGQPDITAPDGFYAIHDYFADRDITYHVSTQIPWTFGAALSRARALLAETRK